MTTSKRSLLTGSALAILLLAAARPAFAEDHERQRVQAKLAKKPEIDHVDKAEIPSANAAPAEKSASYYVPTRGYRLEPQPEIPPYVRTLGKTYKEFEGIDWLDVGLDSRTRFEYRENDYRPWTQTTVNPPASQRRMFPNSLWLLRTRAYLGVQNILDPFRFAVELQDSRAFNSIYQLQGQDINQTDLISAYGELYFKDAFGKDPCGNDRPLTVRAGRMHFEILDRRLIAENEFRNTTNNFDGFRVKIGKKDNDWDLDSFVMRPVVRDPYSFDRPDWRNWIFGSVLSLRRWSDVATVQPYFLGRRQFADWLDPSNGNKIARQTYAPGLRIYGVLGNFDYDADINKQFGQTGEFRDLGAARNAVQTTVQHDAIAYAIETGYTFSDLAWKPRVSAAYNYGSGDKSRFDSANQTVDIFYGFNQPFSRNDYFAWNNMRAVRGRLEFSPTKELRVDTAFNAYWLASAAAAWDRANLVAPLGNRGDFLGTEFDIRFRYKLSQFVNLTASYTRFWPGPFTSSFAPPTALQQFPTSFPGQTGSTNGLTARPTDFFYLEVSANAFGDGKPIVESPIATAAGVAAAAPITGAKAPSWTDYYVGLEGGGAWSTPNSDLRVAGLGPNPTSQLIAEATPPLDTRNHLAGFLGGLYVGGDWKVADRFVVGAEADLHGVSGNTDGKWRGAVVTVGANAYANSTVATTTLNYLGTIRGRLGFLATPTVQLYGTGGFAYGGITSNTAIFTRRLAGTTVTQANPFSQNTLLGWAAGGGVEWAFMPNWSVKAEYLRYDLGTVDSNGFAAHPGGLYQIAAANSTAFAGNLLQAGVSRHFDLIGAATY